MNYLYFFIFVFAINNIAEDYETIELSQTKKDLSKEVYSKLENGHFIKENDKKHFNERYVQAIFEKLDKNKNYFTNKEVNKYVMQSRVYNEYDFDIELAYELINLYFARMIDFSEFQIQLLKNDVFDFNKDEYLDIFYDDNKWATTYNQLEELWRLDTKNDLLVAKISDSASSNPNDDLIKRYKNRIRRINQQKEEDIFSIAINTLANQFDPHSSYLSPRSAEDFDMNMSLKLEGIGALLGVEDDYTKIVSLVPGGPAKKSGKILPDDRITRIRQKDSSEYVDVVGWRIDEVVDLIRGEAGTEVEIEFISSKSSLNERKLVTLKREEIKLEDRAAKSKIYLNDDGQKIGIIDLPSFYFDFKAYQERSEDYKSSSGDVRNILENFNAEGVDALVFDLRNNGGGALMEANKIIGLFVASGPTVQVKHKTGRIQPYGDRRALQVWDKPMVVLVNRYSASASEIVAGAIQDYQRGLIVGQRTFGKGTVQVLEDLSKGQIKITESKYYRVNGTSTQNKGVLPDINLPATWDIETIGESSYPSALEWDTVRAYKHKLFSLDNNKLKNIKELYAKRFLNEPNLNYLEEVRKRYDENQNKKYLTLNIKNREYEKDLRKLWLLNIENQRRISLNLDIFGTFEDLENENDKKDDLVEVDTINLEEDYLLIESINIMEDFLNLNKKIIITKVD